MEIIKILLMCSYPKFYIMSIVVIATASFQLRKIRKLLVYLNIKLKYFKNFKFSFSYLYNTQDCLFVFLIAFLPCYDPNIFL